MGFGIGNQHHRAKLNPPLVRLIRQWRRQNMTYAEITENLGHLVALSTLQAVADGRTWRHVTETTDGGT